MNLYQKSDFKVGQTVYILNEVAYKRAGWFQKYEGVVTNTGTHYLYVDMGNGWVEQFYYSTGREKPKRGKHNQKLLPRYKLFSSKEEFELYAFACEVRSDIEKDLRKKIQAIPLSELLKIKRILDDIPKGEENNGD